MIRRRSRPVGGPPGPSGVCFGFLDFACAFPPAYAVTEAQPGLAPVRIRASYVPNHELEAEHPGRPPAVATAPVDADVALVTRAVDELNRQVDHVIVSYRWGVPGM